MVNSVRILPIRPPLPIGTELLRQLRRRRTIGIAVLILALPLILVAAFAASGEPGDSAPTFVALAQVGGPNLAVFVLFASTGFLLVIVVAMFFGDAVPIEASWGTLRYLLAAPVPRARLLGVKLLGAAVYALGALILLPFWALLVGGVAYGWTNYRSPSGAELTLLAFLLRLLVIIVYLALSLAVVAGLAAVFSVFTDAPLAAVGGAVLIMIVSAIVDTIPTLGPVAEALPGHFAYAWSQVLTDSIDFSTMITGALWSLGYAVLALAVSFWWFGRKDIAS